VFHAVRFIILLTLLLVPVGPGARANDAIGYWQCDGTQWVAVGEPAHALPLRQCGGTPSGEPLLTEELCEAGGGTWGPIGLFPEPVCTQRTADAGMICADINECMASCDANLSSEQYQSMLDGEVVMTTGFCSGATPLIGCHAMIHAGRVDGILCID